MNDHSNIPATGSHPSAPAIAGEEPDSAAEPRRLEERKLLDAKERPKYKARMLRAGWVLERTSGYQSVGKNIEVRTYHWRFDPVTAAAQLRRQARTQKVAGYLVVALIVIGIPLAVIFHQNPNEHGWTSSDIQSFVAKCEASGYVTVPTYCRCVANHVADNVSWGTYQLQLQNNPVDVVITHNELTQGASCTS